VKLQLAFDLARVRLAAQEDFEPMPQPVE